MNSELPTLDALMVRVRSGDREAFSLLYDDVAPVVLGLITRIVHDRAQAEEATQEVFLELWQQAATFSPDKGSAKGWILRLARLRAIDRLRSYQASLARDHKDAVLDAAARVASVEEETLVTLDRHSVQTALGLVGEPHKTALVLAYFEGLTNRELAAATGVPLGTAKTRLRDGIRKLRTVMEQLQESKAVDASTGRGNQR